MSCYQVFLNGAVVGEADVVSEGLYYRFRCRCALPEKAAYRLAVTISAQTYDLGICVPDGAVYTVDKKLPAKRFPKGEMRFSVSCNAGRSAGIPLAEDQPFGYIKSLLNAKLQITAGSYEILLKQDASTA